jgi:hypothetical protein
MEQEADCRRVAEEKGLSVIRAYGDVEWYSVGDKLVESSVSRSDCPALRAMLKDESRDEFDIILAWREDRPYRGLRSMLLVLVTIQEYKIEILLAKESFNPGIAPVLKRSVPNKQRLKSGTKSLNLSTILITCLLKRRLKDPSYRKIINKCSRRNCIFKRKSRG